MSQLHLELCGHQCYIKRCVDVTVTFRVVLMSLLNLELCGRHCYIKSCAGNYILVFPLAFGS